jgi:hypothetical protein
MLSGPAGWDARGGGNVATGPDGVGDSSNSFAALGLGIFFLMKFRIYQDARSCWTDLCLSVIDMSSTLLA